MYFKTFFCGIIAAKNIFEIAQIKNYVYVTKKQTRENIYSMIYTV